MKTILRFKDVVPKKARGAKNKLVAKFIAIATAIAEENEGKVLSATVSNGTITLEVEGEKAIEALTSLMKASEKEVAELSPFDALFEDVAAAQALSEKKSANEKKAK